MADSGQWLLGSIGAKHGPSRAGSVFLLDRGGGFIYIKPCSCTFKICVVTVCKLYHILKVKKKGYRRAPDRRRAHGLTCHEAATERLGGK